MLWPFSALYKERIVFIKQQKHWVSWQFLFSHEEKRKWYTVVLLFCHTKHLELKFKHLSQVLGELASITLLRWQEGVECVQITTHNSCQLTNCECVNIFTVIQMLKLRHLWEAFVCLCLCGQNCYAISCHNIYLCWNDLEIQLLS